MSTRRLVLRGAATLAVAATCPLTRAQSYPAKPITFFVPHAAGGAGDIVARLIAQKMGESMKQSVVIENRPAPMIAPVTVAKSRPDGYTLLMAGSGAALTQVLFKNMPYDLIGDFVHVSMLANFDLTLMTGTQSAFKSTGDVLAYARQNPGKLNIGTIRVGSTQNLAAEMFKAMAGIDAVIVPFKTSAEVISSLRAGDIHVAMEILPPVLGQLRNNVVRPLAVTSVTRFPGLPDVPTLAESGVPGFEASSWNGMSVPAKTPREIVERLNLEVTKALALPEVRKELESLGTVAQSSTPDKMTERMHGDMAKWKAVIEKAGIARQ